MFCFFSSCKALFAAFGWAFQECNKRGNESPSTLFLETGNFFCLSQLFLFVFLFHVLQLKTGMQFKTWNETPSPVSIHPFSWNKKLSFLPDSIAMEICFFHLHYNALQWVKVLTIAFTILVLKTSFTSHKINNYLFLFVLPTWWYINADGEAWTKACAILALKIVPPEQSKPKICDWKCFQ